MHSLCSAVAGKQILSMPSASTKAVSTTDTATNTVAPASNADASATSRERAPTATSDTTRPTVRDASGVTPGLKSKKKINKKFNPIFIHARITPGLQSTMHTCNQPCTPATHRCVCRVKRGLFYFKLRIRDVRCARALHNQTHEIAIFGNFLLICLIFTGRDRPFTFTIVYCFGAVASSMVWPTPDPRSTCVWCVRCVRVVWCGRRHVLVRAP